MLRLFSTSILKLLELFVNSGSPMFIMLFFLPNVDLRGDSRGASYGLRASFFSAGGFEFLMIVN